MNFITRWFKSASVKTKQYDVTLTFTDGAQTTRRVAVNSEAPTIYAVDILRNRTFDVNGVFYPPQALVKGTVSPCE